MIYNCRTEGACEVERSTSEVDTCFLLGIHYSQVRVNRTAELCKEECQADSNWRQKCGLVLDNGEHNNNEDQLGGQEHFDEKSLRYRCSSTESGFNIEVAGKEARYNSSSAEASNYLSEEDQSTSQGRQSSNEEEGKSHLLTLTYAVSCLQVKHIPKD